jgi:hypothetical protein
MPQIMAFVLFCCAIVALVVYFIITKVNKKEKESEVVDILQLQKDVLSTIHTEAKAAGNKNITTAKISKVLLMEAFNLKPKRLKDIIASLKSKQLVDETQDSVSITPFGKQYDDIFGK